MKSSYLTVTDQFCGAGGSSQGARKLANKMGGGLEVSLAMNHWRLAIETHNTNFPDTEHDCADISASDPRRYRSTDILITSPECTNHTQAKGVKRRYQQTDTLFGKLTVDPSAERSRATMWDVPRFAEAHSYNLIIVENVVDARSWIMWDAWLHAMHNLGYLHKCVYLNSMHALPTPQSRDRMYIVFWKKGNKAPDLDFRPKAYCQHCARQVDAIQTWKNPKRKYGKYRTQYIYRCPTCANQVEPYYYAAFNIIDWTIPGERIGDRKKPLAPNTVKRINYGLDKFAESSFVIYTDHTKNLKRVSDISDEIFTQTTSQVAGLVITNRYSTGIGFRVRSVRNVIPTQPGDAAHYLCGFPMLIKNYGGGFDPRNAPIPPTGPVGTVTANDHHAILQSPFIVENYGTSNAKEITEPIGAQTTNITHGLLSNEAVNAFMSYYYGTNRQGSHIIDPLATVSTKDRAALVLSPAGRPDINDCTYRMLKPHEVQAAMAFERDYIVCGSGRDKVKQLGNAVTPPAMEWLLERGIETFM